LLNKKVVVSAGPTQESLDPVRYITNHSSGKMGYAIAKAARNMGADVTLVSGPTNLKKPYGINVVDVKSADDMYHAMIKESVDASIIIMSAAVADYSPVTIADEKIKKNDDELILELKKNKDILFELGQNKKEDQLICGFAMETQDLIENATKKLLKKNCDMIVANNLRTEGAGFGTDTNVVTFIHPDKTETLAQMSKYELGRKILHTLLQKQERITEC
jgi:phosphopantothenoylcysteine decarboxylase/phosphopantothenate--cysteine ligase